MVTTGGAGIWGRIRVLSSIGFRFQGFRLGVWGFGFRV